MQTTFYRINITTKILEAVLTKTVVSTKEENIVDDVASTTFSTLNESEWTEMKHLLEAMAAVCCI